MNRVIAPLLAIAMVSLGGTSARALEPSGDVSGDAALTSQRLTWTACGGGFTCTTVSAPLDWAHPKGTRISIAVNRHAATGTSHGALLVNPGGPGGSGTDFAQAVVASPSFATLTRNLDVVGFDPRGVGRSTQVNCGTDAQTSAGVFTVNAVRGSTRWIAQQRAAEKQLGKACLARSGALLGHVDTVSAARDMELIRTVLGQSKLNYLGFSYGTQLGATFADLFPSRVGRFVLDGAVDPVLSYSQVSVNQARGFQSALRAYVANCVNTLGCPFAGSTVPAALGTIRSYLDTAEASPYITSGGQAITSDTLAVAIFSKLYSSAQWPDLSSLFRALAIGDADQVQSFVSDYWSGGANMAAANHAVNCLDYPVDARPEAMAAERAQLEKAAPTIGTWFAYSALSCSEWPFKAAKQRAPVRAHGANTIVVVGTTNDPATPYSQAVGLARQLESSRLVTFHGEGHTAYGQSQCVRGAADAFLVNGTKPRAGLSCTD